jgi:hypothetical protein
MKGMMVIACVTPALLLATALCIPMSTESCWRPSLEIAPSKLSMIRGGFCFKENPEIDCPPNPFPSGSCDNQVCNAIDRVCPKSYFAAGGLGTYVNSVTMAPPGSGQKSIGSGVVDCNTYEVCETECVPGGVTGWKCEHSSYAHTSEVTEFYVHGENCAGT